MYRSGDKKQQSRIPDECGFKSKWVVQKSMSEIHAIYAGRCMFQSLVVRGMKELKMFVANFMLMINTRRIIRGCCNELIA